MDFFLQTAPITQKLHGPSIDVVSAHENVSSCSNDSNLIRNSINEEVSTICQQSEHIADKLGAFPAIPRTAARQMH